MICKICGKEFDTSRGLGGHISQKHKIKSKDYYDQYLVSDNDGKCLLCGIDTHFIAINKGYNKYCLKCSHNTDESKQKRIQTNIRKYGVPQVLQSSEIKNKAKQTMLQKYGSEEIFSTEHFKQKHKENSLRKYGTDYPIQNKTVFSNCMSSRLHYTYNNLYFDSSWELAVYIYCIDHDIDIIREPISYKYIGLDNKYHMYYPDFQINNTIIEIKGNQYLDEEHKLLDTAKQVCIEQHNIQIWALTEVEPYLKYCEEKFQAVNWYVQFKYKCKQEYKPKKAKSKVYKPVECLICHKIFDNGRYLSAHLKFEEQIIGQDYYDKYLKQPNEGICIVCGKPTKYINFTRGYQVCCNQICNNSPLSNKGKNVSKAKYAYIDDNKTAIKTKREITCLSKYGHK